MDFGLARIAGVALGVLVVLSLLRRAGRRVIPHDPTIDVGREPRARLCERGWFIRYFVVTIDRQDYRVNYDAAGVGERVLVDNHEVARGTGLAALVSRHEFLVGGHRGLIELDVRWGLVIRGFQLSLDDVVLYCEGTFAI